MIDFRYHIVSLISVFLALAVGIALGAGPLKESIGDTLTGQVDQLRAEKDELRVELEQATGSLQDEQEAFAAVAPDLVDGILPGYRVAVVQIGAVDQSVADGVLAQLTASGASVSARVAVTSEWTDPARTAFRGTLASTLVGYLDPRPAADAGTAVELAEALVQALTTADPTDLAAISENAGVLLDLMSGDAGLITIDGTVSTAADAVVVLTGPVTAEDTDAETTGTVSETTEDTTAAPEATTADVPAAQEVTAEEIDAVTLIARSAQERSAGVVVAGGVVSEPGVLTSLRSSSDLAASIATIDNVQRFAGQVSVPMALSATVDGTVGHYGVGELATAAMPGRVVLLPLERVPAVPQPTDAAGDATSPAPEG
ncbi:copper transporter [Actinotalea sp.]|uniref:copper transporter n=1 Tax=Actinotalea sp. TaxID=1872145 RepID=UPI003562A6C2